MKASTLTAADLGETARDGYVFQSDGDPTSVSLYKKMMRLVMHLHPGALTTPELKEFVKIFHLRPGLVKYDVSLESLNPFPTNFPAEGVATLDLETRSLLQTLYFIIEESDHATRSTFSLALELSRLELNPISNRGPVLTLPLGGS